MSFGGRLKALRLSKRLKQSELADKLEMTVSTISAYENGTRTPDINMGKKIANFFNVSTDYLLENEVKKDYTELNNNDEKDIQKEIDKMITDLKLGLYSKDSAEFDEETTELLIASLEHATRIAKIEAKRKFTPNKYRE